MFSNNYRDLYWTTNVEPLFGFGPGTLLVVGYQAGGGFAGAPEVLEIGLVKGVAPGQPIPVPTEWYEPCSSLEYRIGGRDFGGYHYFDARVKGAR